MAKVGVNGFGRMGKLLVRTMLERHPTKIVPSAINDPALTSPKQAAHIFKHDSVHGRFYGDICFDDKHLIINGNKISVHKESDSKKVPWTDSGVDYIAECSGNYTTLDKAQQLITGKVKKVVISAPSPDAPTFVLGVNHCDYKSTLKVISMGSSTTNCLAPLAKVIHSKFGIKEGSITVVQSITPNQSLLDGLSNKQLRLARSAMLNVIPVASQEADIIGKLIPDLQGKIAGIELRIPIPVCALLDFTVRICRSIKLSDINGVLSDAAKCSMSGILCYTEEEVVSSDFIGCTCSLAYDASASVQLGENFFKLVAWFDNEYGYSCRLADLLGYMQEKDAAAECETAQKKDDKQPNKK